MPVSRERRLVVVTGAAGGVAGLLRPHLRAGFDVRLVDRRPPETPAVSGEECVVGDLASPEFAASVVAGADAVVHLAGLPGPRSAWRELLPANIGLTATVLDAAVAAGVPRVVYASSVHAAGRYDLEGRTPVDPSWLARPCCMYGASKVACEASGSWYSDRYQLAVICLRLGWVQPRPRTPRALTCWLSPHDLGELVGCALRAEVGYGIYFGVSANTRNHWDITNARADLGYRPRDDAERFLDEIDFAAVDPPRCQLDVPTAHPDQTPLTGVDR